MEVDSIQMDPKDDCFGAASIEDLTSLGSPDVNNVFGDPLSNPRVGDKYQVDIPSIITESERLELLANPLDSQAMNTSLAFLVGLPIPITWISDDENGTEDGSLGSLRKSKNTVDLNRSLDARNGKKGQTWSRKKSSELIVEEHGVKSRVENFDPTSAGEICFSQLNGSTSCYPASGLTTELWSDSEVDSFLLGLYIFGKNFFQVRRFIGNKDLGAIQAFYYGNFYRSDAHRRWSRGRKKVRRKKCVIGRKIFTGWRQQELLSRLSSHVSEEPQKSLLEGYKSFAEGQTSFEEYVSLLESTVGIPVLVEVIGIGKGKEDLTSIALDPGRSNHDIGPNLSMGLDCSSLTSKEILNLLTGGFRLSKGRCSDIFWDAVWPRLLAKGWHSEQPKNQGYISSKNYLVFLMPGIKKFSRRKLAKGEHYFDSVSDVLNKVASEPKLIELESEECSVGGRNEQDAWSPETGSDQDDQLGPQRHCYLKPRVSTSSSCKMKFTVVDTSLAYGGKSASIRELRYLPAEFKLTSRTTNCLINDEEDSSEDNLDDFKSVEKPSLQGEKARRLKGVSDSGGPNCMKFTVLDTSMVLGGKPGKVRELRCLPQIAKGVSELAGFPRKIVTTGDSLGKHERDASDVPPKIKRKSSKSNCHNDICEGSSPNQMEAKNNSDSADKTEVQLDQNSSVSTEKHVKRTVLHQFKRRAKPGHSDSVVPVVKRRRLTACAKAKTSDLSHNYSQGLGSTETCTKTVSATTLKAEGSLDEDIKLKILRRNCSAVLTSEASNNLNPSQGLVCSIDSGKITEGTEAPEPVVTDGHCSLSKETDLVSELATSTDVDTSEHNTVVNRRQSTRNRPLTARALEALANGFLNIQRRSKNDGVLSGENPFSSPFRKARSSKVKVAPSHGDGVSSGIVVAPPKDDEANGGTCDAKSHRISNALGQVEGNWLTNH